MPDFEIFWGEWVHIELKHELDRKQKSKICSNIIYLLKLECLLVNKIIKLVSIKFLLLLYTLQSFWYLQSNIQSIGRELPDE